MGEFKQLACIFIAYLTACVIITNISFCTLTPFTNAIIEMNSFLNFASGFYYYKYAHVLWDVNNEENTIFDKLSTQSA